MTAAETGYQSILIATDFSAASVSSLKLAVWLSRQFGSNLVLAHTLPDLHRAVHAASYKARMDLLSGDGEILDREIRRTSEIRLSQTIIALDAMDINVKSHCRCEKSTARRFFTNNIVNRDRKKIPQS